MRVTMYPGRTGDIDNPFVTILADALQADGVEVVNFGPLLPIQLCEVFHFHWIESVFWGRLARHSDMIAGAKAARFWRYAAAVRRSGGKVVWTVHNLEPHDVLSPHRKVIWDKLNQRLLPLVTDVILMSGDTVSTLASARPEVREARVHVIPHPHYIDFFARHPSARDIRSELGLEVDCPVFVCIGRIRRYKQLEEIISALQEHYPDEFRLVIAGDGDKQYIQELRNAIAGDRRIVINNGRISHADIVAYFSSADAAIFNFSSILNSGSVLAALSLATPLICPTSAVLDSLAESLGSNWMRCFQPPLLGSWLAKNLRELAAQKDRDPPDLSAMAPDVIGRSHLDVYLGSVT